MVLGCARDVLNGPTVGDALPQLRASDVRELDRRVADAMGQLGIPGVAVGVVHGDAEHVAGFGVTNVEHPLPVDPDTLFSVGSITKPVTATALLRLLPDGTDAGERSRMSEGTENSLPRLDLDAAVRTYVPELRLADEEAAARVTVRQLLTHTGGWVGNAMNWAGPRDYGPNALAEAMPKMAVLPQLAPPGELFAYSNNGYVVAGRVLEVLTGAPFAAVVERLVLAPLGMTRSFFFARRAISHRVAVGHTIEAGRATVHRSTPWGIHPVFNPAGGLAATARDVLRFARLHLEDGRAPDGTRLLTGAALEGMRSPQVVVDGAGTSMGLGWFVRELGGVRVLGHSGFLDGSICYLTVVPERRFAVAILSNGGPERIDIETTQWALERFLGLATPEAQVMLRSERELGEYAGRYEGVWQRLDLEVRAADGGLEVRRVPKGSWAHAAPPPPQRFLFCGEDCVVPAEDRRAAPFDFVRRDGRIGWFRYSRQLYPRVSGELGE